MEEDKVMIKLTPDELRVLNLALDKIIKDSEMAQRIYAGYHEDIMVIGRIAGQVRGLHESVKKGWHERGHM